MFYHSGTNWEASMCMHVANYWMPSTCAYIVLACRQYTSCAIVLMEQALRLQAC